ncbi:KH domain [Musa troglodytarum]|uniref:KH domain n=1 Tax=Musa troglodytarum TaxID=320322 RepID=A0A9E7L3B0_9LILI|nr:KH domain [Musa troglodytarum]
MLILVGIIIGQTGETIKSIRLNSGAKIQVTRNMEAGPNSLTTTVELNGTPEQISSAEKLINDALAEGGFGGSNIISTQESGDMEPGLQHCHPNTPKDMASPSHLPSFGLSKESMAYLVCLMEQFEAEKQIIDQILKGDSGDPGIEELGSAEPIAQKFQMKVPNDKVYAIIGKSGETIKHIRLESGAKIQLTKDTDAGPNSPTTVVELNGTSQQISSAKKLINDVLAEGDLGGSDVIFAQKPGDMEPDVEHRHMKMPKNMGGSVDPGTAFAKESRRMEPGAEWYEMKFPSDKVGAIIGESGETIKRIRLQSGAKIRFPKDTGADIDSPTTTVELYGTVEQMRCAEKLINDAIAESRRRVPGCELFEMKLPSDKVGVIIGKSGETIKRIRLQSGAKIQFAEDTDADTDSPTTVVELCGTIEQIRSARKLISDALAEGGSVDPGTAFAKESRRMEPGAEWFWMKFPSDKVGAIIGESGETIKRIRLQSGAKIQFPKDTGADTDSPTTTVRLHGTIEQMRCAEKLINDAIAESRRREPGSELIAKILPSDKVGAIIGKSGETIKRIRLQSGAKIQFTEDTSAATDSPTTTVELFGTFEQITTAGKLINDALAEDDSGDSDDSSDTE